MVLSLIGLLNEIDTQLASNATGQVSAGKLRPVLKDMVGPRMAFTPSAAPAGYGTLNDPTSAFSGDLSNVRLATSYTITGTNTLTQPTTGYVIHGENSPLFTYYQNHSGWNQQTDGNDGRTAAIAHLMQVNNYGQGDTMGMLIQGFVAGARAGATHFLANPAIVGYAVSFVAGQSGVFLNPSEIELYDEGFDAAAVGVNVNLTRNNGTGALGAVWSGYRAQSFGSASVDHAYMVTGKFKYGLFFPYGVFDNGAAIVTKANARWYGNVAGSDAFSNTISSLGTEFFEYNSGGFWNFVVGNASMLQISSTQVTCVSALSVAGTFFNNPPASAVPFVNGQMIIQATSNTSLTFKLKGSDGTIRSGSITLA